MDDMVVALKSRGLVNPPNECGQLMTYQRG